MATVIDNSVEIQWDTPQTRGRFPWDQWTDGNTYQAITGSKNESGELTPDADDFHSAPAMFVMQLRKRADKESRQIMTKVQRGAVGDPVSVFFKFGPKPPTVEPSTEAASDTPSEPSDATPASEASARRQAANKAQREAKEAAESAK